MKHCRGEVRNALERLDKIEVLIFSAEECRTDLLKSEQECLQACRPSKFVMRLNGAPHLPALHDVFQVCMRPHASPGPLITAHHARPSVRLHCP